MCCLRHVWCYKMSFKQLDTSNGDMMLYHDDDNDDDDDDADDRHVIDTKLLLG